MSVAMTISATEFKAKCLQLLDAVSRRDVETIAVTKRGKVVAVLGPPSAPADEATSLYGCMAGSVIIPEGFDLTAPVLDETFEAESGLLGGERPTGSA